MSASRIVDIAFEAIGMDMDGNPVRGTVTARANVAALSWPSQQWEGCAEGWNPLRGDAPAPIHIVKLLSMAIVDESECSKELLEGKG